MKWCNERLARLRHDVLQGNSCCESGVAARNKAILLRIYEQYQAKFLLAWLAIQDYLFDSESDQGSDFVKLIA